MYQPPGPPGWPPPGPQQPYGWQPPQPQSPPPTSGRGALVAIVAIGATCGMCGVFGALGKRAAPPPPVSSAPGQTWQPSWAPPVPAPARAEPPEVTAAALSGLRQRIHDNACDSFGRRREECRGWYYEIRDIALEPKGGGLYVARVATDLRRPDGENAAVEVCARIATLMPGGAVANMNSSVFVRSPGGGTIASNNMGRCASRLF